MGNSALDHTFYPEAYTRKPHAREKNGRRAETCNAVISRKGRRKDVGNAVASGVLSQRFTLVSEVLLEVFVVCSHLFHRWSLTMV